ncbi:hypothetical protein G6F50_015667 [Rhizopus delemar]|uniref:Uncharacterized protein n=1 Tax=Rhizopus delemar TaxID=936053 RepID=A0A9P6XWG4_9FUNG|nr:hypothetical protein G6F50_015667 [Rhizopus delemar]
MRVHQARQGVHVALLQRLHDAQVLALGMAAPALLHVDPAHEMDAGIDAFQRAHEFFVARQAGQLQVEGFIQLQQARRVAVVRHVPGTLDELPQPGQFFVAGALAGGAHDAGLQYRAVFVQAVDLLGVQQAGDEAPVDRATACD